MGSGESKIINANGHLDMATIINNDEKCSYIKCSPNNISTFVDYQRKSNNLINKYIITNYIINNYIRIYLIFLIFIYIFIWFIIMNKMI